VARDELAAERKKAAAAAAAAAAPSSISTTIKKHKGKGGKKLVIVPSAPSPPPPSFSFDEKEQKEADHKAHSDASSSHSLNYVQLRTELIEKSQHAIHAAYRWDCKLRSMEGMLALVRTKSIESATTLLATSIEPMEGDVMVLLLERMVRDERIFSASNIHTMASHARLIYQHFCAQTYLPPKDANNLRSADQLLGKLMEVTKMHCGLVSKHLGIAKDTAQKFFVDTENVD
jgi:hypothetical protein